MDLSSTLKHFNQLPALLLSRFRPSSLITHPDAALVSPAAKPSLRHSRSLAARLSLSLCVAGPRTSVCIPSSCTRRCFGYICTQKTWLGLGNDFWRLVSNVCDPPLNPPPHSHLHHLFRLSETDPNGFTYLLHAPLLFLSLTISFISTHF